MTIDREESRWAKIMEGKTPQEREQIMADALQRAKDEFFAMMRARPARKPKARKGTRP